MNKEQYLNIASWATGLNEASVFDKGMLSGTKTLEKALKELLKNPSQAGAIAKAFNDAVAKEDPQAIYDAIQKIEIGLGKESPYATNFTNHLVDIWSSDDDGDAIVHWEFMFPKSLTQKIVASKITEDASSVGMNNEALSPATQGKDSAKLDQDIKEKLEAIKNVIESLERDHKTFLLKSKSVKNEKDKLNLRDDLQQFLEYLDRLDQ